MKILDKNIRKTIYQIYIPQFHTILLKTAESNIIHNKRICNTSSKQHNAANVILNVHNISKICTWWSICFISLSFYSPDLVTSDLLYMSISYTSLNKPQFYLLNVCKHNGIENEIYGIFDV